jgi:hypothetical protein
MVCNMMYLRQHPVFYTYLLELLSLLALLCILLCAPVLIPREAFATCPRYESTQKACSFKKVFLAPPQGGQFPHVLRHAFRMVGTEHNQ